MSIIDWLFIACISISILCGVFGMVFFIRIFGTKKEIQRLLAMTPPKRKKKKRLWMRKIKQLRLARKKQRTTAISLFLIGILLVAGGFGGRYYQSTALSKDDTSAIVSGYYLTSEMQGQLALIEEDPSRARTNITELSGRMASFGSKRADGRINVQGQRILNRYYKKMKEFGLNISADLIQILEDEERRQNYVDDLSGILTIQKEVTKHFGLKEDALSKRE
ncbi:hypothetical protein BAU15_07965 [Enterococcus sp. JM4C]|uniref:hypothetical protein n=1 Tax=Candidatus Enterococcus huntleyi TaxID=1857217 RepID=UPI0013794C95|nr:hypothetical protein [Enterococcus sp. JM4C]KAF1297831.1 hypothetical protein BAU15_07965 [Enterococcus sp. JM4C]